MQTHYFKLYDGELKMSFKGHKVTLFLARELERALIQLQADKDLGRSFAGLLPWVEGMHLMGYLDDATYEKYRKRYSTPLNVPAGNWKSKASLRKVEEQFSHAIQHWSEMPEKSRKYILEKAERHKNKIGNAKLVLALGKKEPLELMSHG